MNQSINTDSKNSKEPQQKTGTFQPERAYIPHENQTHLPFLLKVYVCARENPVYVTEHDCFEIGMLTVTSSGLTGSDDETGILVALCFSGTEITVRARKRQTGKVLTAKIKYDW